MEAVRTDETADDTAREFARYYNGRDSASPSRQDKDLKIVKDSCLR